VVLVSPFTSDNAILQVTWVIHLSTSFSHFCENDTLSFHPWEKWWSKQQNYKFLVPLACISFDIPLALSSPLCAKLYLKEDCMAPMMHSVRHARDRKSRVQGKTHS
jgi:hypothetical protein